MLFSVEQAFVGREEIRAPLKTPAWEANLATDFSKVSQRGVVVGTVMQSGQEFFSNPSTVIEFDLIFLLL